MSKKEKESRKKDFVSEAEELLEELTADIQQLEASVKKNNVRPELINKIFRAFHSMKGISGMLGFDRVSSFTHELENMLDKMRLGKVALTRGTIDFIFQALDMLNRMVAEILTEEGHQSDPAVIIRKINDILSEGSSAPETISFPDLDLDEQTLRSLTEYE